MLFIIYYQTSQTCQTTQIPDPCPLTPNIRAKVTKNIFISYFFNLFYISSLVVRHLSFVTRLSSFVTRHFLTFFLYFSLLLSFYFVVYQTATFLVIYIFTIQCFQYIFNVLSLRQNQVSGVRHQGTGVSSYLLPLNF